MKKGKIFNWGMLVVMLLQFTAGPITATVVSASPVTSAETSKGNKQTTADKDVVGNTNAIENSEKTSSSSTSSEATDINSSNDVSGESSVSSEENSENENSNKAPTTKADTSDVKASLIFDPDVGTDTYKANVKVKMFAGLEFSNEQSLAGSVIKLKIPKSTIQPLTQDNIASPTDAGSIITNSSFDNNSDPDYYIITYSMATLTANSNPAVGFSFKLKSPATNGQQSPIIEEVYGTATDTTPLDTMIVNVISSASPGTVTASGSHEYTKDQLTDGQATDKVTGQQIIFEAITDKTDARDLDISVEIPADLDFVASDGWTYDAITRIASHTVTYDANGQSKGYVVPPINVTIHQGVAVPGTSNINVSYNLTNPVIDSDSSKTTGKFTYTVKADEPPFEASQQIRVVFNNSTTDIINAQQYNSVNAIKPGATIVAIISPCDNATKMKDNDSITIKAVHATPRVETSTSLKQTGVQLWPALGSIMDVTGNTPHGELTDDMTKNKVYGIRRSDSQKVELASNITTSQVKFASDKVDVYSDIWIEFDNAVTVTNKQSFDFLVYNELQEKYITDFLNRPVQSSTDLNKSGDNQNWNYSKISEYVNYTSGLSGGTFEAGFGLKKGLLPEYSSSNSVIHNPGETASDPDWLSGNTKELSTTFNFQYMNKEAAPTNVKIAYVLPRGIELGDTSQAIGLTDLQTIPNYHGTGKTVIIGTSTLPATASTHPAYTYLLPIKANAALSKGTQKIEAYMVYDNNDGTYANYDNSVTPTSIVTIGNATNSYGFYDNTANPDGVVQAADTSFNYTPERNLVFSKQVKDKSVSDDKFVTDTGDQEDIGSQLTYRLAVFNNGLSDRSPLGLLDVLPFKGDGLSEFPIHLTGPVTVKNSENNKAGGTDYSDKFDVYYATDTPHPVKEDSYNTANWQTAEQLGNDFSKVTMIKAVMKSGTVLAIGDGVNFDFDAEIPNDTSIKDGDESKNELLATVNNGTSFITTTPAITSVNYQTSSVNVTKVDASDTTKTLTGAQYQLYDYETDQLLNADKTYQTDADGTFSIKNLKPGHYYMREVKAPDGYLLPNNQTQEKIATQFEVVRNQADPTSVTYTDVPVKSLQITKVDQATGLPIAGAEFELKNTETGGTQTLTSNDDGQAYAYNLASGNYQLQETKAPDGYKLNTKVFDITVTDSSTLLMQTVEDTAIAGTVALVKQDQDTKLPLAGATFTITKAGSTDVVTKATSDQAGIVRAVNLKPGKYTIQEVAAPKGYQLATNQKTFTIDEKNDDVDLKVVYNKQVTSAPTDPNQPSKPAEPTQPTNPSGDVQSDKTNNVLENNQAVVASSQKDNKKTKAVKKGNLPQTGEVVERGLVIAGIVLIVIVGILFFRNRRQK